MIYICFNCGAVKKAPFAICSACDQSPHTDEECALSVILSDKQLSAERMAEIIRHLKEGNRLSLPPDIIRGIKSRPDVQWPSDKKAGRKSVPKWAVGLVVGFVAVILFAAFHPWPHYQWASFRDNVASLESFVSRFPASGHASEARERIRLLREDDVWQDAQSSNSIMKVRAYQRTYPDGKYLTEAEQQCTKIADAVWHQMSFTRSVEQIQTFLRQYPETSKRASAEARIRVLYNDIDWVRKQDSLEAYRRFLRNNPTHSQADWIRKRIIDLEVSEIAAGDHGSLPKAIPTQRRRGATHAKVDIKNATGYELTVRYSGLDSKKIVITKGARSELFLPVGDYRVAASVKAARVRSYYGVDTLDAAEYEVEFYIVTETVPEFVPNWRR